jgi:hypothetical protein
MKTLGAILLLLFAFWATEWAWTNFTELGQIDACLDDGGVWSFEQSKCEGDGTSP